MSTLSDTIYWQSRNWDLLTAKNKQFADEYEKCRKAYVNAVKENLINEDDPELGFKFDPRNVKRSMFSVREIINLVQSSLNYSPTQVKELEDALIQLGEVTASTSYYLKFR